MESRDWQTADWAKYAWPDLGWIDRCHWYTESVRVPYDVLFIHRRCLFVSLINLYIRDKTALMISLRQCKTTWYLPAIAQLFPSFFPLRLCMNYWELGCLFKDLILVHVSSWILFSPLMKGKWCGNFSSWSQNLDLLALRSLRLNHRAGTCDEPQCRDLWRAGNPFRLCITPSPQIKGELRGGVKHNLYVLREK